MSLKQSIKIGKKNSMDNDDYENGWTKGEETAEQLIKSYHFMIESGQVQLTQAEIKGFIKGFKNTIEQWYEA